MEDLQHVYDLLNKEITKGEHRIEMIDIIIKTCERLSIEYWCDVRDETVAYLNGLTKAQDIVWKELHK